MMRVTNGMKSTFSCLLSPRLYGDPDSGSDVPTSKYIRPCNDRVIVYRFQDNLLYPPYMEEHAIHQRRDHCMTQMEHHNSSHQILRYVRENKSVNRRSS